MWAELLVLAGAGLIAGYVNTVAGAGSLLTLPVLIFTGLDATAANATNRVAVLFQSAMASVTFHKAGIRVDKIARWSLLPAMISAAAGAWAAAIVPEQALRGIIAAAMVIFLVLSFVKRKGAEADEEKPTFTWRMVPGFMAIGFYAGFLQAGVGVLLLLYLGLAHRMDLVTANAFKVLFVLLLTASALLVFWFTGTPIDALRGLVLASTTTVGAYLGARATLKHGEGFVRVILVATVAASALKLGWDALH